MTNIAFSDKFSSGYTKENLFEIFNSEFKSVDFQQDTCDKFEIIFNSDRVKSCKRSTEIEKIIKQEMKKFKINTNMRKTQQFNYYKILCELEKLERNDVLENFLKIKTTRSKSGIVSMTVFTSGKLLGTDGNNLDTIKTGGCPFDCHFCPSEKNEYGVPTQPRSYLSDEPGNLRATRQKHHPVGQTIDRAHTLEKTGHIFSLDKKSTKIEMIISGATFSFYPKNYIEWFVTCVFYACNTYFDWKHGVARSMKTLEEEQKINEISRLSIIGLTVETRPDFVDLEQIIFMRKLGITRVQLGLQCNRDDILKLIGRKCTDEKNKMGIKILKDNCFKVDGHWMFDLPGMSAKDDKKMMDEIISDPDYELDQWKLYPTEITNFTKIKTWYEQGKYKPYAENHLPNRPSYQLADVISYTLSKVPRRIRVNRVVRDIPHKCIHGGLKMSNLRQIVSDNMKRQNLKCWDIRECEVGTREVNMDDMIIHHDKYIGSKGIDYFISCTSKDKSILYGFLRVRKNLSNEYVIPSLRGKFLFRELHVYGRQTNIGNNIEKTSIQHKGIGKLLMYYGSVIAYLNFCNEIAIIAGVGTRNYYKNKLGYNIGNNDYMYKTINFSYFLYSCYYIINRMYRFVFIKYCLLAVLISCFLKIII